jgi:hypothetical protein|tara:strand:+ start:308 stop:409 length:102 start_codon:yes stop_codon:yes gene_type:complete
MTEGEVKTSVIFKLDIAIPDKHPDKGPVRKLLL